MYIISARRNLGGRRGGLSSRRWPPPPDGGLNNEAGRTRLRLKRDKFRRGERSMMAIFFLEQSQIFPPFLMRFDRR